MRLFTGLVAAVAACVAALPVSAASPISRSQPMDVVQSAGPSVTGRPADTYMPIGQPNLLSFSLGWFAPGSAHDDDQALDARFEHRWGVSLISAAFSNLSHWDRYAQIHPLAGIETSTNGQFYGFGGLAVDVMLFENLILTPSFAAGLYGKGGGKDLGSAFEVRPMIELGYRFQNEVRTSVHYSYMSNAGTGDKNPGADSIGIYLHIPTRSLFGH